MKKLELRLTDLRRDMGGVKIAGPSDGLMLHQGHIQGTFPTNTLRSSDEENVLDIAAKLIASPYEFTVGLSNLTLERTANREKYKSIALVCIGEKQSINNMCEEIIDENALLTYKNRFRLIKGPSQFSSYYYTEVTVEPDKLLARLTENPIRIAFYREDLLKKIKN